MAAPAVRAAAVRDTLDFLDEFEPGSRAKVIARVPEPSREVIEHTPRSGWVPLEHDHHTIDAMIDLYGRARAIECWSDAMLNLSRKPLLETFVRGMLAVVRRDPVRIIGIFAKGWSLAYRDVARLSVARSEAGHAVLRFDDLAPEVAQYPGYLASFEGGCEGFARLTRLDARVHFQAAPDLGRAEAEFVVAGA